MNEEFLKHALKVIDSLTVEELRDGLREAGLELVSIHSGKKLSEVPYANIWVGMEVIGCNGDVGRVDAKYDKENDDKDNLIRIEWSSCSRTTHQHYWYNNVIVK